MSFDTFADDGSGNLSQNPFRTFSNMLFPKTVKHTYVWALWLWNRFDLYRKVIQNVVRYFINDISVVQDNEQQETNSDFIDAATKTLKDDYDILELVRRIGEELAAMGIVIISAMPVIDRYIVCPRCGARYSLRNLEKDTDYKWAGFKFISRCQADGCDYSGEFKREDDARKTGARINFKLWPQDDIRIRYNQITGKSKFYYEIPAEVAADIRKGDEVYLEDTPWTFIEAVETNSYVELKESSMLCLRVDNLASIEKQFNGWSPPLFLPSFSNILQLQMLDRFSEAIAMDYIIPIRMISPPPESLRAGADPNRMPLNGNVVKNHIMSMVKGSRGNPTTWFTSPIPLQYQLIGGEGKTLAPVELHEWRLAQTISGMNIPSEFRQTTFQMVGPTMGLRMFERMWAPFSRNLDKAANWIGEKVGKQHTWEPVRIVLNKTSFVEDELNRNVRLNLLSSGMISRKTGLDTVGIDYDKERRIIEKERLDEASDRAEMQTEMANRGIMGEATSVPPPGAQEAVQQAQAPQAAPAAGAAPGQPMAPAAPASPSAALGDLSNTPTDPADLQAQAQGMAQDLFIMDEASRRRELRNIKSANETLHALVRQALEELSTQAGSQGVAMARQGGM